MKFKDPITISDQCIITFDASKKILNTLNEMDVIMDLSELKITSPKLQKIFNFNNEVYNMGKLLADRYIKQLETIKNQKTEIENLKSDLEKANTEIRTLVETEPRKC